MDLGTMMQMVLSMNLDHDARQKLLRAARGEGGEDVDAAIEIVTRALGLVDDDGNWKKEEIEALAENIGLDVQRETETSET